MGVTGWLFGRILGVFSSVGTVLAIPGDSSTAGTYALSAAKEAERTAPAIPDCKPGSFFSICDDKNPVEPQLKKQGDPQVKT